MTEQRKWRLVPVEPTQEMYAAAMRAWLDYDLPEDCEYSDAQSDALYRAMTAASPSPPPSLEAAAQWQTIDSAPKDGTRIMVWSPERCDNCPPNASGISCVTWANKTWSVGWINNKQEVPLK